MKIEIEIINGVRAGAALRGGRLAVLGASATLAVLAQTANAQEVSSAVDELQEVVVTGTMIHGARPVGSELVTLDREAIVATGAQSTTNLMTSLPQLASFNALPVGTSDFANPVPRFNIRTSGGTLVLLNGHRMVGAGILQTTPDPSAIPLSAIQRVEVLPDGASATYGADAVGGVVNFILRDNYEGGETHVSFGTGSSYHEYDISQLLGTKWSSGSILGSIEYTAHKDFSFGSRSFYLADLTPYGGRTRLVNSCSPATVVVNGVNYAAPGLAANTQNLCDTSAPVDLLPDEKRTTLFLAGHQTISDNVELTGDAYYSKRKQITQVATSTSVFTVGNTNPFFKLPTGVTATSETIRYQFSKEFGATRPSQVDLSTLGINLALHFKLPGDWRATLSGNYGTGTNKAYTPAVDGNVLTAAATGTTTATAFDPFGGQTNASVLASIGGGGVAYKADQGLAEGSLALDGPLFTLPGGAVRLATGLQWRRETLDGVPYQLVNGALVDIQGGPQSAIRRDVAEYIELLVPFVGDSNGLPGLRRLSLSMAGRHDNYSDFGSTTNPKFSVDYSPISGLTLHATTSGSFQAPSLADMRSVDTRLQTQASAGFAPAGAPTNVPEVFIAGGTPDLKAQTARTYTYGFEVAPSGSDFQAGATYWHSRIEKQIGLAFPTQVPLFTNPAFSTFWWGPGGQPLTAAVLNNLLSQFRVDAANAAFTPAYQAALLAGGYILDLRRKNLGTTTLSGVDFSLAQGWKTDYGNFHFSLNGTLELLRKNIPGPGASETDLTANDPYQTRAAIDWSRNAWNAGGNVNFISAFNVTGTDVGTYKAANYASLDLHAGYRIAEGAGVFGNTSITLQMTNVLDRAPPFVISTNGYTTARANPIGRLSSLSLVKRW